MNSNEDDTCFIPSQQPFFALALAAAAHAHSSPADRQAHLRSPPPATDSPRASCEALSKSGAFRVVENFGGGAGIPTAQGAARRRTLHAADGTSAVLVVPRRHGKVPYDPLNAYIPIGPVFRIPLIIVANEKAPQDPKAWWTMRRKSRTDWGSPGLAHPSTSPASSQAGRGRISGRHVTRHAQAVRTFCDQSAVVDGIAPTCRHQGGEAARSRIHGRASASQLPERAHRRGTGLSGLLREGWAAWW